jgi:agmatine deiminase
MIIKELPQTLGFSMPAEWDKHQSTWLCWPQREELWYNAFKEVQKEFVELIKVISLSEKINLLIPQEIKIPFLNKNSELKIIERFDIAYDDVWMRDSGPIFLKNSSQKVSLIDFKFNGWGDKFPYRKDKLIPSKIAQLLNAKYFEGKMTLEGGAIDTNGNGIFLTTKSCVLNKNRNLGKISKNTFEKILRNDLNAKTILWLEDGLINDHTDGHIDMIARFIDPRTLIINFTEDKKNPNFELLNNNLRHLEEQISDLKLNLVIKKIPLPLENRFFNNNLIPQSYTNFYISNSHVIVPTFYDKNDKVVIEILKKEFQTRLVIGIPSYHIILGGGAFHCLTQQQPYGEIYKNEN